MKIERLSLEGRTSNPEFSTRSSTMQPLLSRTTEVPGKLFQDLLEEDTLQKSSINVIKDEQILKEEDFRKRSSSEFNYIII